MPKSTHSTKSDLRFAKELADAFQVKLEEAEAWADQIAVRKASIEWRIREADLYERARKLLDEETDESE